MDSLRVRLTKQMIENALLALLEEKNLEKITVLELCKKAEVNRTTFYKYYGSPFDVLESIIESFFCGLREASHIDNNGNIFSENMLHYLYENKEKCLILLDYLPYETFTKRLLNIDAFESQFIDLFSDVYTEEQKEYLLNAYRHAIFGILSYWLHQKRPLSTDELQDITNKLAQNILFK